MITENIPLPRLLPAFGYAERRITPIQHGVTITQKITPLSYATIQLAPGETLPKRGYVELYTCMGSAGIFRVRSPQESYGDDSATAELEHAVVEVGDYLVRNKYDQMMGAVTAMQTVFSYYGGSLWQLGNINALGPGDIALSAEYDKVLTVMLNILSQRPDCMMTFDFSTSPRWTINIVSRGSTVEAEGRLSRNINNAKISYDDTDLCTRVYYEKPSTTDIVTDGYPVFDPQKWYAAGIYVIYENKLYDLTEGHNAGVTWANTTKTAITDIPTTVWDYVEDSTARNTYGLIERTVSTGSGFTEEEAEYTASQYLRTHKQPRISVQISAEELSCVTGEDLDTFEIGKLCRLALVDYNTTIEQNITELTFNDVYENPTDIVVGLADEEDMVVNFLHDVDAKGGTTSGGGGKKKTEDKFKDYYTDIKKDDYHIELISAHADEARGILQAAGIDINSQTGVVIYHEDIENSVGSRITVESNRIGLVVQGTGANASIKAAQIWASIDTELRRSQVTISADIIDIDGLVEYLKAKQVEVYTLTVNNFTELQDVDCGDIDCTYITTNTGNADIGGALDVGGRLDVGGAIDGDSWIQGSSFYISGNGNPATWQSIEVGTGLDIDWYDSKTFATCDTNNNITGHYTMQTLDLISLDKETIYYLGHT